MSAETLISEADFKLSMRHLAGAVSVITVGDGEDRTGFTATSVSSFSAERPSVIVSVSRALTVPPRRGRCCNGTAASVSTCSPPISRVWRNPLPALMDAKALNAMAMRNGIALRPARPPLKGLLQ